jgi:hypothetical protein
MCQSLESWLYRALLSVLVAYKTTALIYAGMLCKCVSFILCNVIVAVSYNSVEYVYHLMGLYTIGFSDKGGTLPYQFVCQYFYELYFANPMFGMI